MQHKIIETQHKSNEISPEIIENDHPCRIDVQLYNIESYIISQSLTRYAP